MTLLKVGVDPNTPARQVQHFCISGLGQKQVKMNFMDFPKTF
jgi:hypothetical protein